jgi:hypothetical protein
VAKSIYTGGQLVSHLTDAVNAGVTDLLVLKHEVSSPDPAVTLTPANGIGVGISVAVQDAADINKISGMDFTLLDITDGSEDAQLRINTITAGSMAAAMVRLL